jgi:hypothetical protein
MRVSHLLTFFFSRTCVSDPSTLVGLLLRLFNAMSVYPETLARQEEYEHEWMKGITPVVIYSFVWY